MMTTTPQEKIKWAYVSHIVPIEAVAQWEKRPDSPRIGDLGLHRVLVLGKHTRMDNRESRVHYLLPGDLVATAYGNRYATDQYEGFVPPASEQYHMLSIGGVCGMVATRNAAMPDPTILEFVGYAIDGKGKIVNLRDYRLRAVKSAKKGRSFKTILSVGASMNSGKTTTACMAIRGLSRAGYKVAAAKLTGTGAVKDLHFMRDAGAEKVLDFTDYGCPSTSRTSLRKLLRLTRTLQSHLAVLDPDFVVYEVADGIFQRETALLLSNSEFRSHIDYTLFSAPDSLAAESGKRALLSRGFNLVGFSGIASASELGIQEVRKATGLPCLSSTQLSEGGILTLIGAEVKSKRKAG
jgi:hypothetical protein